MESIERKNEKYAVVFNVNLIRATLNEASEFKNYLAETIHDSEKDIIVNLSACEHLDSTFLGVLVSGYKRLKSQNRSLVIIEPVDQSSIFLTLNSIGKIFPLYTSVKVALEDIENKKLLEKEINELSDAKSDAFENEPLVNSTISDISETIEEELNADALTTDEFQGSSENLTELHSESIVEEGNLTEDNLAEPELEISSDFKVEESVNPEHEESQVIIKRDRVTEESHFGSSGIKWEFGFSS